MPEKRDVNGCLFYETYLELCEYAQNMQLVNHCIYGATNIGSNVVLFHFISGSMSF